MFVCVCLLAYVYVRPGEVVIAVVIMVSTKWICVVYLGWLTYYSWVLEGRGKGDGDE